MLLVLGVLVFTVMSFFPIVIVILIISRLFLGIGLLKLMLLLGLVIEVLLYISILLRVLS